MWNEMRARERVKVSEGEGEGRCDDRNNDDRKNMLLR